MEDQKSLPKKVLYPMEIPLEATYYGSISNSNATPTFGEVMALQVSDMLAKNEFSVCVIA
jgi:hypothetical protein